MVKQKSLKEYIDRRWSIPTYGQKSSGKVVTPKHDTTVDDKYPKSPKNIVIDK